MLKLWLPLEEVFPSQDLSLLDLLFNSVGPEDSRSFILSDEPLLSGSFSSDFWSKRLDDWDLTDLVIVKAERPSGFFLDFFDRHKHATTKHNRIAATPSMT